MKNTKLLLIVIAMFGLFAIIVTATPEGPTSKTYEDNQTNSYGSAVVSNLSKGYISWMILEGTTQTSAWKGYVGNITGKLALEDSSGDLLYDWTVSTPNGEVYATASPTTPSWANIECANLGNLTAEEGNLSHGARDDRVMKTFGTPDHPEFSVAAVTITADTCNTTNTYVSGSSQSSEFEEVVLMDNEDRIIYTTLINDSAVGFDGTNFDFQMIVPDAPTGDNTAYYFYLELE